MKINKLKNMSNEPERFSENLSIASWAMPQK